MRLLSYLCFLALIVQSSLAQNSKDSFYYRKIAQPGVQFIPVNNGKYKVFTQKAGTGKIKLLLLHGGPVNTHEYFENFPDHLKGQNIEVYFYDQLGSYYSDQPDDTAIWNVNRFVDEVEEVRKGLKLESFYILGHSWGAFLGQLYAAKYPEHLKGLVLSNAPVEIRDTAKRNVFINAWRDSIHKKASRLTLFSWLLASQLDSIRNGIASKDTARFNPLKKLYDQKRDSVMMRDYVYRLPGPLPEPMTRNISHIDRKRQAAFLPKVFLPDYPAADEKIKCPVLILGGVHDRWFPHVYEDMKKQFMQTKVQVYLCPEGSHFSMWDDSANYFRELGRFIREVEETAGNLHK